MRQKNLFSRISEPEMSAFLVKREQTANDIAALMLKAEKESRRYVGQVAPYFEAPTIYESAQRVFYFLRKNIPYQREPAQIQSAKTLPRIMADAREGRGNDCKHYATFAVAVLNHLGAPAYFRLVSFFGKKNPSHAYCVVKNKAGKEIIIDACLENFNQQSNFSRKYDIKPLN